MANLDLLGPPEEQATVEDVLLAQEWVLNHD